MTISRLNDSGAPPRSAQPPRVVSGLRRFARAAGRGTEPEPERCGLCGEILSGETLGGNIAGGEIAGEGHGHLVDIQQRSLVCACRACALLFTRPGAAGGRYRTVPDRVRNDPDAPLSAAEWDELRIPVSIAFFFVNSALGHVVASYPSPAGVTECELDLAAWDKVAADHPLLRALAPDVEAILTVAGPASQSGPGAGGQGTGGHGTGDRGIETFLVPIDLCYGLAGSLRLNWRGFDGGTEARALLAGFLDDLRRRSLALTTDREG